MGATGTGNDLAVAPLARGPLQGRNSRTKKSGNQDQLTSRVHLAFLRLCLGIFLASNKKNEFQVTTRRWWPRNFLATEMAGKKERKKL